jgi:hypothetical protein
VLRQAGIPFEEVRIPLYRPSRRRTGGLVAFGQGAGVEINGVGHDIHGRAKSMIVSDPIFPTM